MLLVAATDDPLPDVDGNNLGVESTGFWAAIFGRVLPVAPTVAPEPEVDATDELGARLTKLWIATFGEVLPVAVTTNPEPEDGAYGVALPAKF